MTALRTDNVYVEVLVPQAYASPPPVAVRVDNVYAEGLTPQAYASPPPVAVRTDAVYAEGLTPQAYASPPPVAVRTDAVYAEMLTRVMGTEIHYVDQVGVFAGSSATWATPIISVQRSVHPPSGIPSGEIFGTLGVVPIIGPVGIPSAEVFGYKNLFFWYDDFASSGELVGETGTIESANIGADMEAGEPPVLSGSGAATVWFRITPVYDGFLALDTQGSTAQDLTGSMYPETWLYPEEDLFLTEEPAVVGLDTVLDVYTGYGFGNLKLVAHNDDTAEGVAFGEGGFGDGGFGGGGLWSSLIMPVDGGTTYYVRVNSWDDVTGLIVLNWTLTHAAIVLPAGLVSIESWGNELTRNQASFEYGVDGWVPDDASCTLLSVLTP